MKELKLTLDSTLFACLQRAAQRDGKTVNAAILDGIGAYLEAAHDAANADDSSFESSPFVSGLN